MAQRGCACHPTRLWTGFVINASRTTKHAAHSQICAAPPGGVNKIAAFGALSRAQGRFPIC